MMVTRRPKSPDPEPALYLGLPITEAHVKTKPVTAGLDRQLAVEPDLADVPAGTVIYVAAAYVVGDRTMKPVGGDPLEPESWGITATAVPLDDSCMILRGKEAEPVERMISDHRNSLIAHEARLEDERARAAQERARAAQTAGRRRKGQLAVGEDGSEDPDGPEADVPTIKVGEAESGSNVVAAEFGKPS